MPGVSNTAPQVFHRLIAKRNQRRRRGRVTSLFVVSADLRDGKAQAGLDRVEQTAFADTTLSRQRGLFATQQCTQVLDVGSGFSGRQ